MPTVTLVSPTDGSNLTGNSFSYHWSGGSVSLHYADQYINGAFSRRATWLPGVTEATKGSSLATADWAALANWSSNTWTIVATGYDAIEYTTDTWLFVKAVGAPNKATTPVPSSGSTGVDFSSFQLSWVSGGGADTYNVYIGGTQTSVLQANPSYMTSLLELESIYSASPINQVISWRVDSTNGNGTTTGDTWTFDARPAKATTPSPANAATGITTFPTFTWV